MTGYGRALSEVDDCRVAIEIRSVNHRFLDLKLRGAALDVTTEERVASLVRARVARGSVHVTVRIDAETAEQWPTIDVDAARHFSSQLRVLATIVGHRGDIPLTAVIQQSGVWRLPREQGFRAGAAVERAVGEALDALVEMREREGGGLAADLRERLALLRNLAEGVVDEAKDSPRQTQLRLQDRVQRLLSAASVEVDPQRLAHEVALLADRADVTEELVRLRSHIDQLEELLASDNQVGRRMEFLMQELGREFNTIGSKAQSSRIARFVIDAKSEIEKMREQVQNVE